MILFNASPVDVVGMYDSVTYRIPARKFLEVSELVGDHLLATRGLKGIGRFKLGTTGQALKDMDYELVGNCVQFYERCLLYHKRMNQDLTARDLNPVPPSDAVKEANEVLPVLMEHYKKLEDTVGASQKAARKAELSEKMGMMGDAPNLDSLDVEGLRSQALSRGIDANPQWNAVTLRKKIRDHDAVIEEPNPLGGEDLTKPTDPPGGLAP